MSSQQSFMEAVKARRTYYQLNKEAPISDKKITELVEQAVLHVPSSFNTQSARLVVLLNKDHEQFWEYVAEVLKPLVPEDAFPTTEKKLQGFRAAKGTVSVSHDSSQCDSSGMWWLLEPAEPQYWRRFYDPSPTYAMMQLPHGKWPHMKATWLQILQPRLQYTTTDPQSDHVHLEIVLSGYCC